MPRGEKTKELWKNPKYRKYMKEIHKERRVSPETEFKKGQSPWNKGKRGLQKAWNKGIPCSEKSRRKNSETHIKRGLSKGEKNPAFNNWSSREPYGVEFSPELKEKIRERDNHTCQECFFTQKQLKKKLAVHHIDFNKQNNNPNNLITLCNSCHSQTNFNRQNWIGYFQNKLNARRKIYAI